MEIQFSILIYGINIYIRDGGESRICIYENIYIDVKSAWTHEILVGRN